MAAYSCSSFSFADPSRAWASSLSSAGVEPRGAVPAAAQVWRQAFGAAQYVWLTPQNYLRIAWTPALYRYFAQHFTLIPETSDPLLLYARNGLHPHVPPALPQP